MLVETGRVVAVEQDGVWVETVRSSTCGSCAARKGCGHGLMNQISDGQRGLVRVLPGRILPSECHLNDEVEISIPEEVILTGSLVVYIMPLLVMLAGAGMAARYTDGDLASALGAVGGLALGMLLVRWHAHRHRNDRRLQPQLMAIVSRTTVPVRLA
jgi:sigma-E factor negative regulatory protein RseC